MQITSVLDKPAAGVSDAVKIRSGVRRHAPATLTAWILFCLFCNCTGWILSAVHQLNSIGYTVAFVAGASLLLLFRRGLFPDRIRYGKLLLKLKRRFRRPFPLAFLVLATLAFFGGLFHEANNY